MDIRILPADKKEAAEILNLQKACYLSEAAIYNDYSIPPLMQDLESITEEFETFYFLKATLNDKIIGSVRGKLDGTTCLIGKLIVLPEFQNKGIGRELMRSIEGHFSNSLRYEIFTGDKSVKNLGLYERLGYAPFKTNLINEDLSLIYLEKENNFS